MILQIGNTDFPLNYANSVVHYQDAVPTFNLYFSVPNESKTYFEPLAYALLDLSQVKIFRDNGEEYDFEDYSPVEFVENYADDTLDIQVHLAKPFELGDKAMQKMINGEQEAEPVDEPAEPLVYYPTDEEMRGPEGIEEGDNI